MDNILSPHEIETLARSNGRKMAECCFEAGIKFSTFWRWKERGAKIGLENYQRLLAAASRKIIKD